MKLSVAWIFDHIGSDWRKIPIDQLVEKFNKTTAEIEGYSRVTVDLDLFSLVRVVSVDKAGVLAKSSEWKKELQLPARDDAKKGALFLVKRDGKNYSWATLADLHCPKDGLMVSLHVDEKLQSGDWKKDFEKEDYLIEVDNKSITHRPDMWSHRGFAREIAAMFDLPFEPFEKFSVAKEIKSYDKTFPGDKENPIAMSLKDQKVGKRFVGLHVSSIKNQPSSLKISYRLMRTGNRPLDSIIDATNYVMLDVGQPMHAFDTSFVPAVEARLARKGEKLVLLDDQEIELTPEDYVITDGKQPVSLAGVMGGKQSGIRPDTKSLFLEAANFDATAVRKTSARFKVRTESSARFEKTLDPNQTIDAITRFLKVLEDEGIEYTAANTIISLGKEVQKLTINVRHDFICKRLGVDLDPEFIVACLNKLEFSVVQSGEGDDREYAVAVPTFRSSKDVTAPEDIIEELLRYFGYENIPHELPQKRLAPSDLSSVMRIRNIKQLLAHGLAMREVYNYAFYDEQFLHELRFEPKNTVEIQNPVAEHWRRLVTSLMPHLLKNIKQGSADNERLQFFEWARVWRQISGKAHEHKELAGVIFVKNNGVDFYGEKALLNKLFEMLGMDVQWKAADEKQLPPWCAPYQTAELVLNGARIGFAGKAHAAMFSKVSEGEAFLFELDGDALLNYKLPLKIYEPAIKYPGVHRDVSLLVPVATTVAQIVQTIESSDERVCDVSLVDFFQKDEWKDRKSVTVSFVVQDATKTLTAEEADQVQQQIIEKLEKLGATIR